MPNSSQDKLFKNPFTPENLAQSINPWSWWFEGSANQNQNGLINITNYKSRNPKLEQSIVSEVAGYGMQLDVIEDMLEMMISFIPEGKITNHHDQIIKKFQKMKNEIKVHKEQAALEQLGANGIYGIISALETLKKSNPEAYKTAIKQLKEVI